MWFQAGRPAQQSLIGGGVQSIALRWVSGRRRRVSPTQKLYECILIWLGCVDPPMKRYFAAPSMTSLVRWEEGWGMGMASTRRQKIDLGLIAVGSCLPMTYLHWWLRLSHCVTCAWRPWGRPTVLVEVDNGFPTKVFVYLYHFECRGCSGDATFACLS